jgi:hypothetical protein
MVPIWLICVLSTLFTTKFVYDASGTDFEQERIAGRLLNGSLDSQRVCDRQVITDDLDLGVLVERRPSLPVILVKGVLNRADVVLLDVSVVNRSQLSASQSLALVRVGVLLISTGMAEHVSGPP